MKAYLVLFICVLIGCGSEGGIENAIAGQAFAPEDSTEKGRNGRDGVNCFDRVQDKNLDGDVDVDDCIGDKGDAGEQGLAGTNGAKGDKGDQGDQGLQGERGLQGEQGLAGATGAKGDQGDQGLQGVQGARGPSVLAYDANDELVGFAFKTDNFPVSITVLTGDDYFNTVSVSTGKTIGYLRPNGLLSTYVLFPNPDCMGGDLAVVDEPMPNQIIQISVGKRLTTDAAAAPYHYRSYATLTANGYDCTNDDQTINAYALSMNWYSEPAVGPLTFDYE